MDGHGVRAGRRAGPLSALAIYKRKLTTDDVGKILGRNDGV